MHEEPNDTPATPEQKPPAAPADDGVRSAELQRFWEAIKRLPAYLRLVTAMVRDSEVPGAAKAMLGVGGVYAVSPIDLVPGVIPVAGQLDDLYVLLTAIQQAVKRTPAAVAEHHLELAGISREDIDGDLQSIRDLVRVAVVKSVRFGGKILERASRAAVRFANEPFRQDRAG